MARTNSPPRLTACTQRKRPKRQAEFLKEFRRTGNIKASADHCGVSRTTVYNWQAEDDEFSGEMNKALDDYIDTLEREADRRAVEGIEKAVFYQGVRCDDGQVRDYSDTLLMFRLNGLRPEKYKRGEPKTSDGTAHNEAAEALRDVGKKLPG